MNARVLSVGPRAAERAWLQPGTSRVPRAETCPVRRRCITERRRLVVYGPPARGINQRWWWQALKDLPTTVRSACRNRSRAAEVPSSILLDARTSPSAESPGPTMLKVATHAKPALKRVAYGGGAICRIV